jgi:UDP-glucose 4-epimerase
LRAVVTGGAGFVGSHVVEALLARGDDVLVLDDLSTGKRENVPEGARLEVVDIREPLDEHLEGAKACFHLAAQADVQTSMQRPDHDAAVNVVGTVRVLEAARLAGARVVFTSSGGAIYGECEGPVSEDAPRRAVSPYGIAKLCGEEYVDGWNRIHGLGNVVLRLANVYGPRQVAELEGGVVAIFLEQLGRGEQTTIFGDGLQTRDFVYIGDVVSALLAAAGQEGGVFNVGTGVETTILDLHHACARVVGSQVQPRFEDARLGDARRSVLDVSLAERELGWTPQVGLEEGLRLTWESL